MAYFADPNMDEDENQQPAGQGQQLAGQGGMISASGSGGGQQQQQQGQSADKGTKSGNWTNLTRYLDANQGAGQQLGQAVQGTVNVAGDEYGTKSKAYGDTATAKVSDSTVKDDGTIGTLGGLFGDPAPAQRPVSQSKPATTSGRGPTQAGAPATTTNTRGAAVATVPDPAAKPTLNQLNATQVQKQLGGQWNGPNAASEIDGYGDAEKAGQKLSTYSRQAGDYTDSGQILSDTYGKGQQYGRGERQLDTFLLGGDSAGKAALDDIVSKYGGTQKGWEDQLAGVNTAIKGGQEATAKTAADTKAAVDAARARGTKVMDYGAGQVEQKTAADKAILDAFSKGDPAALAKYGLGPEDIAFAKANGIDLGTMVQGNAGGYNVGDFVSEAHKNDWQQLMGALGDTSNIYNLDASGATGVGVMSDRTAALDKLEGLTAKGQAALKKDPRQEQLGLLMSRLNSFNPEQRAAAAKELGISDADLAYFNEKGGDIGKYLSASSGKLGLGDVMSEGDRKQYADLMKMLGGQGSPLTTSGSSPYSWNKSGFSQALQALRDAELRGAPPSAAPATAYTNTAAQGGAAAGKATNPLGIDVTSFPEIPLKVPKLKLGGRR